MKRSRQRNKKRTLLSNAIDAPMVEIFGGTLALLIILFAMINLIISEDVRAMLERSTENAKFKVSWTEGAEGLVVLSYPDKIRILETNQVIHRNKLCTAQNPFMQYVEKIYNNSKQQIIFAILEGGVKTMAIARNCMLSRNPHRPISIGWLIANQDLLNTVKLQDLPARIKRAVKQSR